MDYQTFLEMLPAYALGDLNATDARQVETLLHDDPDATQLLAEYRAIAVAVLLTAPTHQPPLGLEAKLRARLHNSAPTQPQRRPMNWIGWGIVAAAAVLIVVSAVWLSRLNQTVSTPNPTPIPGSEAYATLAAHPQSVALALVPVVAVDAEGELLYRIDTTQVMLRLAHLPPLNADQAYQLWAIEGGDGEERYTPIAVYHWYNSGQTTYYVEIALPQPLNAYQRLGMSLEPLSGSPFDTPSGPRLLNIPLH